ncbi:hypothetical protein ACOWPK_15785 [Pseudomonas aeruginosa]|nr:MULTISPECIES: hypothetical protein [Pseudomonas]MDS9707904.1 hypothetical protein [Pseudomonas aeruginosa]
MNTEQFIRESAARGLSRRDTGPSTEKAFFLPTGDTPHTLFLAG